MELISQCDIAYTCSFSRARLCKYYNNNGETIYCGNSDGLNCAHPEAQKEALFYELEALYGIKLEMPMGGSPEEEEA